MSYYETERHREAFYTATTSLCHLPGVNLWARFSESTGKQLEGKPVAVHVLWATRPQSIETEKEKQDMIM